MAYHEAMYLDPRIQNLLRSSHPAALYSQIASASYAPHLYGMIPGAPPGLGIPSLHERIKLEEEHHRRIREEEKAREREREEREREMREREQREREQKEKEAREREMREKEAREREQREKEARERELRDREIREMKEREAREREAREREHALQSHLLHSAMQRPFNLLQLFPSMPLGLRPPSSMHPALHHSPHPSLLGLGMPHNPSMLPHSTPNSLPLAHSISPPTNSIAGKSSHRLGLPPPNLSMYGPPPAHGYSGNPNDLLSGQTPPAHLSVSNNYPGSSYHQQHSRELQRESMSAIASSPQSLNLSKHSVPSSGDSSPYNLYQNIPSKSQDPAPNTDTPVSAAQSMATNCTNTLNISKHSSTHNNSNSNNINNSKEDSQISMKKSMSSQQQQPHYQSKTEDTKETLNSENNIETVAQKPTESNSKENEKELSLDKSPPKIPKDTQLTSVDQQRSAENEHQNSNSSSILINSSDNDNSENKNTKNQGNSPKQDVLSNNNDSTKATEANESTMKAQINEDSSNSRSSNKQKQSTTKNNSNENNTEIKLPINKNDRIR